MHFIDQTLTRLNNLFIVFAGIAVLLLMTIATVNVCLRPFGVPYRGTYEIVSFLGAIVTAFALGETQKNKSNIVVDIISDRFPSVVQQLIEIVGYLISSFFFTTVGYVLFRWGKQIAESGELSETLKIVYYPLVYLVAFGFLTLSLTLLVDFLKSFSRKKYRKKS